MKKILILDQAEFIGGAEYYMLDILSFLVKNKKFSITIWGAENENYAKNLSPKISQENFYFPSLKNKLLALLKLPIQSFLLARKVKKYCPDVVISNTPRTHLVMSLARVWWKINPFWWSFKVNWKIIIHEYSIPKIIIWWLGFCCEKIITVSPRLKNFIENYTSTKVVILPNGLDKNDWKIAGNNCQKKSSHKFKLLCIGRIDERKGQFLFLQALKILMGKSDVEFSAEIIGDPVQNEIATLNYQEKCQKFSQENKLPVTFLPATKKIKTIILSADLIIIPSIVPESFGRVVIESFACGKPVLAFNQYGISDTIKLWGEGEKVEKECGKNFPGKKISDVFIAKKNSVEDLSQKILQLIQARNSLESFSQSQQDFVWKHYNLEEIVKEWEQEILS